MKIYCDNNNKASVFVRIAHKYTNTHSQHYIYFECECQKTKERRKKTVFIFRRCDSAPSTARAPMTDFFGRCYLVLVCGLTIEFRRNGTTTTYHVYIYDFRPAAGTISKRRMRWIKNWKYTPRIDVGGASSVCVCAALALYSGKTM